MLIVSSQRSETNRRESRQQRIQPLAVLPVFYKLKGRRVLVAGGSDAAAWKAHLLAAAGAFIELYAVERDETFETLLEASQLRWHQRPWTSSSFEGAQMAIGDFDTAGEAQAFFCAARQAGVPVNVIDKPDFCDFQFGSIVNRSPAVISISTDGAAPIFGQAIRRRIETLLPPSLQGWTQMARDLRADINARLVPGPQRRAFWEWFVDRAFSGNVNAGTKAALLAQSERILASNAGDRGQVTMVGAGPGDAELITLQAMRALQAVDVILVDKTVSKDVLELARREAKRIDIGSHDDGCGQKIVTNMMVKLAGNGKHIARLCAGDPLQSKVIAMQIAHLRQAGIDVRVVPGIASDPGMETKAMMLGSIQPKPTDQRVSPVQAPRRLA